MGFWSFLYRFVPDVWFEGMTLRSYTGVMLVNSIKSRRRDRILRWAANRLKREYTPEVIAKLYERYSKVEKLSPGREEKNRRKFEKKLDKFVANFIYDYKIFRMYYLDALQIISNSLLNDKRQGKKQFTDIEVLFAELKKNRTQLIFPHREIQIFKWQLRELLFDLKLNVRYDEQSDTSEARGGYPASVSFFSFLSPKKWWSRRKIYKKEKKEIRTLGQELKFYDMLYAKINEEIQKGVRQDFLFVLIEFFKRVDIADKRLENIKQDLGLVLKKLWDEIEDVKKVLTDILNLLRNEPQIKDNNEFGKIQSDIAQLETTFREIIKQDFKNTEALKKILDEVLSESSIIMQELEEQSVKSAA